MTNILSGMGMNEFDDRGDFGISYNPSTDCGEETAICTEGGKYYILLGNHTEAYKDKSLNECLEYFKKHEDQKSYWSNSLEDR